MQNTGTPYRQEKTHGFKVTPMGETSGRAIGSFCEKVFSALIVFLLRLFKITGE